jgi:hypothetical protein
MVWLLWLGGGALLLVVGFLLDYAKDRFLALEARVKALEGVEDFVHARIKYDSDLENDKRYAERCQQLTDSCEPAPGNGLR